MKFSFRKNKITTDHEITIEHEYECVYWFCIDKKRIYRWNVYKYLTGPGEKYAYYAYALQYLLGKFNTLHEAKASLMERYIIENEVDKQSKLLDG